MENVESILVDSGLDIDNLEFVSGDNYRRYNYFGNCINTVDVDMMWNATEMSNVIYESKLLKDNKILDKINGGDRKIPMKLIKLLKRFRIEDYEHFVCGVNEYQRIMFIYSVDDDIHYFFDVKR